MDHSAWFGAVHGVGNQSIRLDHRLPRRAGIWKSQARKPKAKVAAAIYRRLGFSFSSAREPIFA